REKVEFELISQGTKTGERVVIKVVPSSSLKLDLASLGMTDDMIATLMGKISDPGMVIISAPAGQGLTSTWQSTLNNADRFTRDFVGVAEADDRETERENIDIKRVVAGQSASELLPSMILKEPNAFVMPKIADQATMELLTEQVTGGDRTLITKIQANNAVEALLRLMTVSSDRSRFVRSVTVIINQRLVRRLCDKCKTPVQVKPQAIRQMGGDPNSDTVLYKDYQLPPVEQRVDEEGKPVEMLPCTSCTGIGFKGRTAIYEVLVVNDAIRQALLKNPKLDFIGQVARQQGNLTLLQQAYRAVLDGRTSMSEVQRVFQPKK
ncbi:MAG: ATPase, T2SS/T4P/T4SS family, partial [Pirellulaceae bacterium]|nr:ATPase, T2SS/T4P/T4SS family [Pirellulaceae bacterium]